MTTTLIDGNYTNGINAFRSKASPSNPLPFLYALADCVKKHGPDWMRTDEGKAILFSLLIMAYGPLFILDSIKEFERLDQAIPRA